MNKQMTQQHIKALCDILANSDPKCGLTESEIRVKLGQCAIDIIDKGNQSNGYTYQFGLNKRDWLYNCFAAEIIKAKSFQKIYYFIENALDPVNITPAEKREKYKFLFDGVNMITSFTTATQSNGPSLWH